jgi:hypothetical protein
LIVVLFLTVQGQQWLLRFRADRLMADMQKLRLYQSTWEDAERLMKGWGAWGHYDGTCSAAHCQYRILLTDVSNADSPFATWVGSHGGFRLNDFLGGRAARVFASFAIQDGTILRKESGFLVSTTQLGHWYGSEEYPLALIVQTKSRSRLKESQADWWILGDDEQLAAHPFYKAGRPGGCKINCEEAVVTYSTRTPSDEIDRLTSFDLSCLTRFSPCKELDQLLPAAAEWHLYKDEDVNLRRIEAAAHRPCDIPLWAIARDARYALAIVGVSAGRQQRSDPVDGGSKFEIEEAHIKINAVLKGTPPWPLPSTVTAYPYPGYPYEADTLKYAEHLEPRKSYIVFPVGDDRKDQKLTEKSPMQLDRCDVWDDTPENRRLVESGIAQNDSFHGPESH